MACSTGHPETMASFGSLDLRKEYANAFRTESYNVFWTRVLALTAPGNGAATSTSTSTAAARLPSYRLFAELLLDPDQPTVAKSLVLSQPRDRPENHALLADYFSETTAASLLCGLLLKDIEQTRLLYRPLRTTFQTPQPYTAANCPSSSSSFADHLAAFSNCPNPFCPTAASPIRFRAVQARCAGLLRRLESRREKVQTQLRRLTGLKRGLSVFVVALAALTTVAAVVVAAHACVVFVAMPMPIPAVLPGYLRMGGRRRAAARAWAQVDAAAKGMYIVSKDLETISSVVERVEEEVEHARRMVRFWGERRRRREEEDEEMLGEEVVREVRKNEASFVGQLDELEEHLYLCLMTINRARYLVMKEILTMT